jgi:hypothetical protein
MGDVVSTGAESDIEGKGAFEEIAGAAAGKESDWKGGVAVAVVIGGVGSSGGVEGPGWDMGEEKSAAGGVAAIL